jgi:hypothetical protein
MRSTMISSTDSCIFVGKVRLSLISVDRLENSLVLAIVEIYLLVFFVLVVTVSSLDFLKIIHGGMLKQF